MSRDCDANERCAGYDGPKPKRELTFWESLFGASDDCAPDSSCTCCSACGNSKCTCNKLLCDHLKKCAGLGQLPPLIEKCEDIPGYRTGPGRSTCTDKKDCGNETRTPEKCCPPPPKKESCPPPPKKECCPPPPKKECCPPPPPPPKIECPPPPKKECCPPPPPKKDCGCARPPPPKQDCGCPPPPKKDCGCAPPPPKKDCGCAPPPPKDCNTSPKDDCCAPPKKIEFKCPPMPETDCCECRPAWMTCPPEFTKMYPIPEGAQVLPISVGGRNKGGGNCGDKGSGVKPKASANCPMMKPKCPGLVKEETGGGGMMAKLASIFGKK